MNSAWKDISEHEAEVRIKLVIAWLTSDAGLSASLLEVRQQLRELRSLRDYHTLIRFLNGRARDPSNVRSRSWHQ